MILAASYAGVGFGNAGLHLPHGMSYPVSGMVRDYHPAGYPAGEPMVPHGISVVLNAPAAFRFTGPGCPERHLQAAEFLGADVSRAKAADAGDILADQLIKLMQRLRVPNGLSAIGYTRDDIPALVEGTLQQHRVIALPPARSSPLKISNLVMVIDRFSTTNFCPETIHDFEDGMRNTTCDAI
jgi:hydroxyacid-oxoacid transhydrogenase